MKTPVCLSVLFASIGLMLSPLSVVHASSPPTDSAHFCAFDAYEQWEREHPRPAAKRLANLNRGQPRTVRMIYFLPNDWPYRQEVVDSMKTVIPRVQTFYAEQMQAHGYGNKTFLFETDAQGEPLVHRVDGQHTFSHYDNTLGTAVVAELEETFDLDANIYVIVLGTDALRQGNGQPAGGVGWRRTKNGGALVMANHFSFFVVAHELGHTFGLYHDFRDDAYTMSYGWSPDRLSACAAEFLSVHTYFNSAIPIAEGQPPTVEIISNTRYQPGTTSVPVRLQVSDSEGLHQVMLIGNAKPCRGLAGEKEADVEFNYNGKYWEGGFSALDDQPRHHLFIVAIDAKGNVSETNSFLAEISPYEIATLSGDTEHIGSVAFSPVEAILAVGPWGTGSFILWDVSTQERIGTLDGAGGAWATAFSPDGTQLAIQDELLIQLWDVASRRKTATLQGHSDGVTSLAYSPDGGLLASGSSDSTVKLWDVEGRKEIATLKGHEAQVNAVAFSPDGTLLASGSGDSWKLEKATVRLWDVQRRAEIATLASTLGAVEGVAFSPDGKSLVWTSWPDAKVRVVDVESREPIASFEGSSFVLSPDGTRIACFSGAITLRETGTGRKIATLPDAYHSTKMSISSDGTILAAGSFSFGTITLWDVSEWMGSRPHTVVETTGDEQPETEQETEQEPTTDGQSTSQTLAAVSGDGQEGPASTQLAEPLVVSVVDEDGAAMAGIDVTFAVTAGGGMLSSATDVNPCIFKSSKSSITAATDANGQATTRLTLGSDPGTNTVEATVAGLEPVTFTATAAEQATPHRLTKVCGDDQEGTAGKQLTEPFVVSVVDEDSSAMAGVDVSFAVTAGGGTLSAATATTNATGHARTRLTLGSELGTNTVVAAVEGLESVTFTATGQADPLVSLFDAFGSGKRVTLPDSPQLAQNAPNPFNSQTVLAYFLPASGPVRVEVFALSGQRVAVLRQGPQQAGYHRLRWNGHDDAGHPVASGMYLYRLVTDEIVLTRKLILLR